MTLVARRVGETSALKRSGVAPTLRAFVKKLRFQLLSDHNTNNIDNLDGPSSSTMNKMPPAMGNMPSMLDDTAPIEYEQDGPRDLPNKFISDLESPSPEASMQNSPAAGSLGAHPLEKARRTNVADQLIGLAALPEVRSIPWRTGLEMPEAIHSERVPVRAAVMLSTVSRATLGEEL